MDISIVSFFQKRLVVHANEEPSPPAPASPPLAPASPPLDPASPPAPVSPPAPPSLLLLPFGYSPPSAGG